MKIKIITKIIFALLIVTFFVETSFGQPIYFAGNQSAKIQSSKINGADLTQLVVGSVGLYGIAADQINKKLYYTNVVTDEIFISELDGSTPTVFLNGISDTVDGPRGIAVDNKNNRIYWAESISGKIRSSNLDGDSTWTIISGLVSPVDVALDLVNNKLYWSDNGIGEKKISKSNLDGTTKGDFITGLNQVGGIEIDVENGKLYWIDFGDPDKVSMTNLDDSSTTVILKTITSGSPRGIAIDRYSGKLFWSDVLDSSISKTNLDGTSEVKILSDLGHPVGISGDNPATLPVLAQLKIFIEGPYNTVNNNMNTDIAALIPIISPYAENDRIIDSVPADIADWVLVELRETSNGQAVASKSVLLHKDGRIVADDGTNSTIRISADPKPYYIVIKHRNHLAVMSESAVNLTTN